MGEFVVLIILDGWGIAPPGQGNAIHLARTPTYDSLLRRWPHSKLRCSGRAAGLPDGQMGNSEVGHITIGAGRVVLQPYTRLNDAVKAEELGRNVAFSSLLECVRKRGRDIHLLGLVSDGGVHSHYRHLFAFMRLCRDSGHNPWIHVFLDGRDTPPISAMNYLELLDAEMRRTSGRIATIMGRYYAMDRDTRWDRTKMAFDAIVHARGRKARNWEDALRTAYRSGETDEFVIPTVLEGYNGMRDGDGAIIYNFRPDRVRQIARALTKEEFDAFDREVMPRIDLASPTEIAPDVRADIAFPNIEIANTLGEVISRHGKQLRVAETEKYAHVTFFFNNGRERPFDGEERILIPSPKVATYDLKPDMSAHEITQALLNRLDGDHLLYVVNYANPDMVGHTGMLEPAVKAIETVDQCLGRLVPEILKSGGDLLITGDHGNAERMTDDKGRPVTAHTTNPVPFIAAGDDVKGLRAREGELKDIAPTVLRLLSIPQPEEMSGICLLETI